MQGRNFVDDTLVHSELFIYARDKRNKIGTHKLATLKKKKKKGRKKRTEKKGPG